MKSKRIRRRDRAIRRDRRSRLRGHVDLVGWAREDGTMFVDMVRDGVTVGSFVATATGRIRPTESAARREDEVRVPVRTDIDYNKLELLLREPQLNTFSMGCGS